jgi:inner membrane protein
METNLLERFNNWLKESVTIKLLSIGFLVLILMIPSSWIETLVNERQARAESVIAEISDKWSGRQTISGPVLVLPFIQREKIDKGKDGIEIREWTEKSYFLPQELNIDGEINPERLRRGIFDAVVYESKLKLKAQFANPDFQKLNINLNDVMWKDAYLILGLTDLRGITHDPVFKAGNDSLAGEPSNQIYFSGGSRDDQASGGNGIIIKLPWQSVTDFTGDVDMQVNLKGSTMISFAPTGKDTNVKLKSPWPNPSFDGEFLPSTRDVGPSGFMAEWNILHYNRPFSQQWIGEAQKISGAEFGVKLLIPVDQYQKSMRTTKYCQLIILLTFIALLMVEIMRKIRIHPFQYILIGAALIIYYTLLLSFSEHIGYNVAYVIATVSTVILVSLYSSTFLDTRKLVFIFGGLLLFFYSFVFVIIQLQDYSLLVGSVGLFFIISLIMYFSKNIKWYKDEKAVTEKSINSETL